MKATGIVRRIDDLGRVVIPKEIRRTMRIREGDPLEIFTDRDGEVILKKYAPIGELGDFAQQYADSLNQTTGHIALLADRDVIIAVSGAPKKEFMDKRIGDPIEHALETGGFVATDDPGGEADFEGPLVGFDDYRDQYTSYAIAPIMRGGDAIGAVILLSKEEGTTMGETEQTLITTGAEFLAKQMED